MTPQAAAKELEEVMKRVREAQSFISAAIEPGKAAVSLYSHSLKTIDSQNWKEFQDYTAQFLHCTNKKTETQEQE